jgi:tRNA (cmo5U34)-methyltransferase
MGDEGGQYHFFPEHYLELVRSEVPAYDRFEDAVGAAGAGGTVARVLDLGTGTGETLRRVAGHHPDAALVGIDESEEMLAAARRVVPGARLECRHVEDPLPDGPFDLVVGALTVHHLDGPGKQDLFRRVAAALRAGGRFVLGDVIVPDDPADAITPIDGVYDTPDRLDDQLAWLDAAGFTTQVTWHERDLAVVVGTVRA